jgi:hypothetical protein
MWVINQDNEPGPNYGRYVVGHYMPVGGDHILKVLESFPGNEIGKGNAMHLVHFLNGGTKSSYLELLLGRLGSIADEIGNVAACI